MINPPKFFALIGDVVRSRDLSNRAEVQLLLRELMASSMGSDFVSPLVLLRGDEIQGLFHRPSAALKVVFEFADKLHPVQVTWGLGAGTLSTDLFPEVEQMDGLCFHRAREALEFARRQKHWVEARGFGEVGDGLISTFCQLIQTARSRWTPRQVEWVRQARTGKRQVEIAKSFDVSPSVISEGLKAASFSTVRNGEEALMNYLKEFGPRAEFSFNSALGPNSS